MSTSIPARTHERLLPAAALSAAAYSGCIGFHRG